jgi:hypothetical protein
MKAFQIATAMRVRCDCDARANPRNEHCIVYESVSNCDCAAMKSQRSRIAVAAHAHRSRKWKLSLKLNVPRRGLVKLVNSAAAGALKIAAGAHETGAGTITCQIKRSRGPAYFNP